MLYDLRSILMSVVARDIVIRAFNHGSIEYNIIKKFSIIVSWRSLNSDQIKIVIYHIEITNLSYHVIPSLSVSGKRTSSKLLTGTFADISAAVHRL